MKQVLLRSRSHAIIRSRETIFNATSMFYEINQYTVEKLQLLKNSAACNPKTCVHSARLSKARSPTSEVDFE